MWTGRGAGLERLRQFRGDAARDRALRAERSGPSNARAVVRAALIEPPPVVRREPARKTQSRTINRYVHRPAKDFASPSHTQCTPEPRRPASYFFACKGV